MQNIPVPNAEKHNPYGKLIQIQNLAIAIQSRNVISKDKVDKLIRKTCKQRPSDLDQIRQQEIGLRTQTQLLELGRYLSPGSFEHYIADMWCHEQRKAGSLFDAATQYAIIAALLSRSTAATRAD